MVTTGQERNLTWMGHSLWTNLPKTMAYGNQDPAALPFLLLVIFYFFSVKCNALASFNSSILISFVVWLLTLLTPPPRGAHIQGAYIRGWELTSGGIISPGGVISGGLITETLPSLEATTGFSNKNRNIKYLFPSPQPPYDTKKLLRRSETGIKKALRNKL